MRIKKGWDPGNFGQSWLQLCCAVNLFLQKPSEDSRVFVFFLLWVAKESYFKARNTCQHPSMAPRADDANMTRSEVRLQMRPLQNLSQKTGGLKKEMKCAEKNNTPNKLLHNLLESENKIPSVRNLIFSSLLAGERHVSCLRASSCALVAFCGYQ